jgi:hypothetical protein
MEQEKSLPFRQTLKAMDIHGSYEVMAADLAVVVLKFL